MCTVSVLKLGQQTVVTMNRDEARHRHEAGIKQQTHGDTQLLYPVDGQAGGTWFGFNNHGLVLALLNRYQDPQHSGAPSRGKIIPQALALGSYQAVEQHLAEQNYQHFNPFDLLLVSAKHCQHFSWSGKHLSQQPLNDKAIQLSSSALNTQQVLASRKLRFQQWLAQQPSSAERVLSDIHLQQCQENRSHSVLMDRDEAHSKSICQVRLSSQHSEFDYYPEASLQAWRQQLSQHPESLDASLLDKQQRQLSIIQPDVINEVTL
ncbi:NRDE family protein [Agarivorans aestuarii]|uniref:NRDE family protein n=1 Tax=Agarivorans aestuarii TaxID=1563703 RepID=A0ABU7G5J6_9ALTE|nr:NRDE family protein [Agarivorans aestuarii]MEE1674673.1 NRDE family protein [Agarivorans aestuarii]